MYTSHTSCLKINIRHVGWITNNVKEDTKAQTGNVTSLTGINMGGEDQKDPAALTTVIIY